MAAAIRLSPWTASRRRGVMWQADVNLGSIPAQHTHSKAPYAQIIKAESQVQHGQARLHPKNRHPRPEILLAPQHTAVSARPHLLPHQATDSNAQGISMWSQHNPFPERPLSLDRPCMQGPATNGRELCATPGFEEGTSHTPRPLCISIEGKARPSLGLRPAPGRKCTPFLCRARCRPHIYPLVIGR